MSSAKLLIHRKHTYPDGLIVEVKIWQLPGSSDERSHGLKYSLQCCYVDGTLVVRYDNEEGKGDHRHFRGVEEPYLFTDVDTLFADFRRDVEVGRR